jgi:hypothetical protein
VKSRTSVDDEGEFWTPWRSVDTVAVEDTAPVEGEPTEAEPTETVAVEDTAADRPRPWFLRGRGHGVSAVSMVLVVVAAVCAVCTLSPVRTVLRQSFTRISSPSRQLYLNGNPWVSGQFLNVPLGIFTQDGPSTGSYRIHVWTVNRAGQTDASTTVTLPIRDGKGTGNFSLPIPTDAQLVWAQLVGTSLSVHYRFAGSALPSMSASASASAGASAGKSR